LRVIFIIVPAIEDDILRILEIELEAISPPWTHGALLSEIYKDDSYFVVAVDNTEYPSRRNILGFAILRCVGDDGELLQIAVDNKARRNGIGDLLMGAALGYAGEKLLKSVFLEVRKSNEAAVRLYAKNGFNILRIRKRYYTNPVEDALVMVKGLI
jgi:ribosomal-protein-alanine N-acetyltransferase